MDQVDARCTTEGHFLRVIDAHSLARFDIACDCGALVLLSAKLYTGDGLLTERNVIAASEPCPACGQPLTAHGEGLGQISAEGCARLAEPTLAVGTTDDFGPPSSIAEYLANRDRPR